jgi:hypothetical protein
LISCWWRQTIICQSHLSLNFLLLSNMTGLWRARKCHINCDGSTKDRIEANEHYVTLKFLWYAVWDSKFLRINIRSLTLMLRRVFVRCWAENF